VAVQEVRKWAVITLHPSLPSKTEQIARARAWGVSESRLSKADISALVIDDVRKVTATNNWSAKLPVRAEFVRSMHHVQPEGEMIFFATPRCIGFGSAHARQTIEELWGVGLQVYVHSVGALYRRGDDLTELMEAVEREANTANVRAYRKRKKS
jgi:hypothetical protein